MGIWPGLQNVVVSQMIVIPCFTMAIVAAFSWKSGSKLEIPGTVFLSKLRDAWYAPHASFASLPKVSFFISRLLCVNQLDSCCFTASRLPLTSFGTVVAGGKTIAVSGLQFTAGTILYLSGKDFCCTLGSLSSLKIVKGSQIKPGFVSVGYRKILILIP